MGMDATEATVKALARELRDAEIRHDAADITRLTHALANAQAARDEAFGVRVDARKPMPWRPARRRFSR